MTPQEGRQYSPCIQMVPEPLWGNNMRARITQTKWDKVRARLLEERGMTCEMCGKQEALSRSLHLHEEWEYDEITTPATATLLSMSLICWHCHACEHWGRTKQLATKGYPKAIDDTIDHFCRLNGVTEDEFRTHELTALEDWNRRNQLEWRIDLGNIQNWIADIIAASRAGGKQPLQVVPLSPIAAALDPIFNMKAKRAEYDAARRAAKKSKEVENDGEASAFH